MRSFFAVVIFAVIAASLAGAPQFVPANTVGELLQANGVQNVQDVPLDVRQMFIGNDGHRFYHAVSDKRQFVFAGYLLRRLPRQGDEPDDRKIHVIWADTTAKQLKYGAFSPGRSSGAIMKIIPTKDFVYISTHLSPSAENTFVLTRDLKMQREIYGYPLEVLANGSLVFHNSQVHFAPTHVAELSIYDPALQIERKIYPPAKSDPVRTDFVGRVRAAYARRGQNWFAANNHHMNPEQFDSSAGRLVVDEKARTLAFLVRYDNKINDAGDPLTSHQDVVTTCTSADNVERTVCKERSLDAWVGALKLSKQAILSESLDLIPRTRELLGRAAMNPALVP
jgi:hypothetical protein